ncbi:leucine rich repeat protein, BspA family [Entamoeba histolytica]
MQLGYNEIMIVSKYFEDINDFINLEIGIKRFQGNMERFHFNPIPLNQHSRKLFPNIETFHIYNKEDEIFKEGRIIKYVIWYDVSYSRYLKEKKEMNEYKNIAYTQEDRNTYGNTIPIEVKSLGFRCFYRCYDIQSINIPTNVSKIGNYCFKYCSSLQTIEIPTSISKIGGSCFSECYSLTSLNIPTSVIEIGDDCFIRCSSLTSINIEDIKYISEERIFMNEAVLISIEIPKNLKMINGKIIEKKDINEFNIPSTITEIGYKCFSGCTSLRTINIPTSVIEIGEYCFYECSSLTSINIPTSVIEIGDDCFEKCLSLQSINIPTSISEIGDFWFYGCSSLKSINIPTSVIEIGDCCCEECTLTSINIPSSITSFRNGCFYGCGCEEELKKNKSIPKYCFKECFEEY